MIVKELVKIIEELGGSATLEQITEKYFKKYKMMEDREISFSIETTLKESKELVYFDSNNNVWCIGKQNKMTNDVVRKPVKRDTLVNNVKEIKRDYFNNDEKIKLYEDRNSLNYKGVQLFATKIGYKVCFKDSNIQSQDQLDSITKRCIVYVHYGSEKQYPRISWDVSKCVKLNAKGYKNLTNGYFSCDDIDVELAI